MKEHSHERRSHRYAPGGRRPRPRGNGDTSAAEADMVKAYRHHANSYGMKQVDLHQFIKLMQAPGNYWLVWNPYPFEEDRAGTVPGKQP